MKITRNELLWLGSWLILALTAGGLGLALALVEISGRHP